MKYCNLIFAVLLAAVGSMGNETESLFQRLKNDYAAEPSIESVNDVLQKLRNDGTWPGITYDKKGDTPIKHLKNIRKLAEGYEHFCTMSEQKDFCGNITKSVDNSLKYWFANNDKFVSSNWWTNEIGIQQEFAAVAFLMWPEISAPLKQKIISQFPETPSRTGTNRTWISELVVMRGVLEQREPMVHLGLREIESTILETGAEGHQVDHSFCMHGSLLYSNGYGKVSISIASHWAFLCKGTRYAFSPETQDALTTLALEGNRWMMWKGMVDPMTMGREITRKGENKDALGFLPIIDRLASVDSVHSKEYDAWRREVKGSNVLRGCRYYWRGEMLVCRSNDFYTSLKMSSKKTVGSELVNRENRKGLWLGTGVLSLYRHGYDFDDIHPLWDWSKIPGVTSSREYEQSEKYLTNPSEFVAGLSDDNAAVATMEVKKKGVNGKKTWLFVDGKVIALGSDIGSERDDEITTSLDQRYFRTEVLGKNKLNVVMDSIYSLDAVWHDSIGYKSLDGKPFQLQVQKRKGNWKDIGTQRGEESDSLFTIWRSHGVKPKAEKYAYFIEMNVGKKQFAKWAGKNDVTILANDGKSQVVRYQSQYVAGALYEAQTIEVKPYKIMFSAPCLFLLRQQGSELQFVVADPTKKQEQMKISVEKNVKGKAPLEYSANVFFPQSLEAGKSVNVLFEL